MASASARPNTSTRRTRPRWSSKMTPAQRAILPGRQPACELWPRLVRLRSQGHPLLSHGGSLPGYRTRRCSCPAQTRRRRPGKPQPKFHDRSGRQTQSSTGSSNCPRRIGTRTTSNSKRNSERRSIRRKPASKTTHRRYEAVARTESVCRHYQNPAYGKAVLGRKRTACRSRGAVSICPWSTGTTTRFAMSRLARTSWKANTSYSPSKRTAPFAGSAGLDRSFSGEPSPVRQRSEGEGGRRVAKSQASIGRRTWAGDTDLGKGAFLLGIVLAFLTLCWHKTRYGRSLSVGAGTTTCATSWWCRVYPALTMRPRFTARSSRAARPSVSPLIPRAESIEELAAVKPG